MDGSDPIKVLLVEDDPVWRENLSAFLSREQDITIVGLAKTKEESLQLFKQLEVDVVLMDIMLTPPDQYDGIDAALELLNLGMNKIIMLTSVDQEEVILDVFDCMVGVEAINYLFKPSYIDIPGAVRDIHQNKVKIHSDVSNTLVTGYRKERKLRILTPTEREVFNLREKGMSQAKIAKMLHKSISTVKNQWKMIRLKLGGD